MTKFEEEAKEKILNTSRLYIAHEGAHADVDKGGGIALKIKDVVYVFPWLEFARNWHSDEEFQELLDKYSNLNDNYEKELIRSSKLESQIIGLKPQLQQEAVPVVPECVGEWIECVKGKNKNALALLDDDNMPDDVNEWLFFQRHDKNINLILRAWLDGYTVEKPQLFYLRDELTGQFLAKDNQFKNEDRYFFWNGADPLTHSIGTAWKLTFTQQEIDSMETGSYELVPVEDGE